MTTPEALQKLIEVLRRKHFALSRERSYVAWLRRYCDFVKRLPTHGASEQKLERFLTQLAKENVSASTQNQAFNAVIFFYKEVLGAELKGVNALRARRPARMRRAPGRAESLELLRVVHAQENLAVSLAARLLYGCGLRVTEPLNLRLRDVDLEGAKRVIRGAKGSKDRVVSVPCSVVVELCEQMESARAVWRHDHREGIAVALPGQLGVKYSKAGWEPGWAWLFPAVRLSVCSRTGKLMRWRLHEAVVQRAIRKASRNLGGSIMPHELRHAYATHCLERGANPRAIQQAMGHRSLETTMGYLHGEAVEVTSPLD
jgi:site-specific recombinase XerD